MQTEQAIKQLVVPDKIGARLLLIANHLIQGLGDNLASLIAYGSIVRGGFNPRSSDVNLLIILKHSTPEAHTVIQAISAGKLRVDPMVIEHNEIPRAARVFALKFMSIHRNCLILHGCDPLADTQVPDQQLAFLVEQEIRNQRMRLIHAFVMSGKRPRIYSQYVIHHAKAILVDLSDLLRAASIDVPTEFSDRIPVISQHIGISADTLIDLLNLHQVSPRMNRPETERLHRKLLQLFRTSINWMEKQWPTPPI